MQATHILGGDLTYERNRFTTLPNQYYVRARLYRDLTTQADYTAQIPLMVARNGCSTTEAGSFTSSLNRVSTQPISGMGCAGGFAYQLIVFEGVVQLPPGRWLLSINEENRTNGIRNILASETRAFHIEAYLDNSTGISNNSPKFTAYTLPYAGGSQLHRYSFSTFDSEGDSLVYQSVPPQTYTSQQNTCAADIPYGSYAAGTFQDANGQAISYPARTFSAANPLFSFQANNGVAASYFQLNAATGELLTLPLINQLGPFVVAVRVDEFRLLNGTWIKIGSVTRDVIYTVRNNGTNRNPILSALTSGNASLPLGQPIRVTPGQALSLTLAGADPDAGQTVTMNSDVAWFLPEATFTRPVANQGRLIWQVPTTLPHGRYSLAVTLEDNGCPSVGSEVATLTFRVGAQTLATKTAQPQVLTAFPLPFHDQVQFQLEARRTQAVIVTDELGREVARLTSRPDGLVVWQPAATVSAGLYFARTADGRQVARLLRSAQ
ncbi:hypothetical protein [Hymenobacter cellulosilyticus]|uniref:Uncharacterized protein n=1 Tax=Hymenobacter cellulosilyticus TaxID=2932248 RepID=A0A8T9Q424_9BACT|nr:hypothetical protein [Hymenobacter cellulosilyticus]UOQ72237.1 hypothetical protein MUN79_27400 [Hymenobacter cellulosilyticus]